MEGTAPPVGEVGKRRRLGKFMGSVILSQVARWATGKGIPGRGNSICKGMETGK